MGFIVTSVKVKDELWKAAKIAAIKEGRDMQDINSEALKEWLQKRKYSIEVTPREI